MTAAERFKRLFEFRPAAPRSLKPGLYHFLRVSAGVQTRFHLRAEPDGYGLLLANASLAARLSPAGALIAHSLLSGQSEATVLRALGETFRGAGRAELERDVARLRDLITTLQVPGDGAPVLNLDDAAWLDRPRQFLAPLQADVPLAPPEQLRPVIARLWEIGVPQVTISVPAGPDRAHLVQAVERAEDTGLICGVRGRASDLRAAGLLPDLARAGLDHVNLYYASDQPEPHDRLLGAGDHAAAHAGWAEAQALELYPVAEVPLVEATLPRLTETLSDLRARGVLDCAVFAIAEIVETPDDAVGAEALPQAAALVEEAAEASRVRYLWHPPVRRNPALSLAEQVRRGPRCSGDVAMRVEPDGAVFAPRGPRHSAGNLLTTSWDEIWAHPVFQRYRERLQAVTRCDRCPGLTVCAADCPREPAGWAEEA
ncbi:MAG: SPASM domain-containing protein [Anaerolineales bacterium]|nr:SPASM domain-containing protein [Anaerolineales bacterium]